MGFASTVPAFKAALLARLQGDSTLTADSTATGGKLTIAWGDPHPERAESGLVAIGATSSRTVEYTASMTQANERYEVSVLVSVIDRVNNSREALWTRAYALADAVTESLRAWNATGLDGVVERAWVTGSSDDEAVDAAIREASITLTVSVLGRMVA